MTIPAHAEAVSQALGIGSWASERAANRIDMFSAQERVLEAQQGRAFSGQMLRVRAAGRADSDSAAVTRRPLRRSSDYAVNPGIGLSRTTTEIEAETGWARSHETGRLKACKTIHRKALSCVAEQRQAKLMSAA